jgi:hypothetical protein
LCFIYPLKCVLLPIFCVSGDLSWFSLSYLSRRYYWTRKHISISIILLHHAQHLLCIRRERNQQHRLSTPQCPQRRPLITLSTSDLTLSISWVQVLGGSLVAFNTIDSKPAGSEFGKGWKCIWNFLESSNDAVRTNATNSFVSISTCFTPALTDAAMADRPGARPSARSSRG